MRYRLRRNKLLTPLFAALGGTSDRSYVDVTSEGLHFRFGFFTMKVTFAEIERVDATRWPLLFGLGWRIAPGEAIGLVGSTEGTVAVELRSPRTVRILIPWSCRRIIVSLLDPHGFIADVSARLEAGRGGISIVETPREAGERAPA